MLTTQIYQLYRESWKIKKKHPHFLSKTGLKQPAFYMGFALRREYVIFLEILQNSPIQFGYTFDSPTKKVAFN